MQGRIFIGVILALLAPLAVASGQAAGDGSKPIEDRAAKIARMYRELDGTCRYPVLEKYRQDQRLLCGIDALRQRCNAIDDCYAYCLGQGVGEGVGGGCAHLCNYAGREAWAPPEAEAACAK